MQVPGPQIFHALAAVPVLTAGEVAVVGRLELDWVRCGLVIIVHDCALLSYCLPLGDSEQPAAL